MYSKKILYITPDFYPTNWWYANATTNFINSLINNSDKYYLYIFSNIPLSKSIKEIELNNKWEVLRIPYKNIPFKWIISQFFWYFEILKFIKNKEIDIIFFETLEFPLLILLFLKKFDKNKIILRIHGTTETETVVFKKWLYYKIIKILNKKILKNLTYIISTTKYYFYFINKYYFKDNLYLYSNKKYLILNNVISDKKINGDNFLNIFKEKYNLKHSDRIYVTLWRLNEDWFIQKWIEDLLISLSYIKEKLNNDKFFIFWKGEKIKYIQELINKYSLEKFVYHIDYIENNDLQELMQVSTIVLLSRFEWQSMFALEALKNWSILLFTKWWWHSDLVFNGENWYLVPIKDYIAIWEAILKISNLSKQELEMMHKKSSEIYIKNYSESMLIKQFDNICSLI